MRMAYFGALFGASLAIGCGGGDDEKSNADGFEGVDRDVAGVIDDFAEAGSGGDGARVCDEIFADALKRNIERESKQSCASEVRENLPEDEYELDVDTIQVDGNSATVTVTDQDDNRSALIMTKTGDDWRIFRVRAAP
ncbi:MAG: hypothetical protein QOJ22_1281 [Thermoleophilaceae bacterium]|nr:hypothetical protein [Thermoleophilaceae bacterium]